MRNGSVSRHYMPSGRSLLHAWGRVAERSIVGYKPVMMLGNCLAPSSDRREAATDRNSVLLASSRAPSDSTSCYGTAGIASSASSDHQRSHPRFSTVGRRVSRARTVFSIRTTVLHSHLISDSHSSFADLLKANRSCSRRPPRYASHSYLKRLSWC